MDMKRLCSTRGCQNQLTLAGQFPSSVSLICKEIRRLAYEIEDFQAVTKCEKYKTSVRKKHKELFSE